jgi:hypothetical protein
MRREKPLGIMGTVLGQAKNLVINIGHNREKIRLKTTNTTSRYFWLIPTMLAGVEEDLVEVDLGVDLGPPDGEIHLLYLAVDMVLIYLVDGTHQYPIPMDSIVPILQI